MTRKDWKNFWLWLEKNWLRILIFLALWLILGLGIYQLLFFVPGSMLLGIDKILSSEPSMDENEVRFSISLWVSCGLNALLFYLYFKQKKDLILLKDTLQILGYLHGENIWSKLPFDEFDKEKNLVLGLALKAKGVAERFDSNRHELRKILDKLNKNEPWWYDWLEELDGIILDNIEDWIKQHFPKEVYFIRLRLLEDYIQATKQGKYLVYDKSEGLPNDKTMIVKSKDEFLISGGKLPVEFYKLILNEYHSDYKEFQAQPVSFDHRLFRKYFTIEGAVWGFLREAYWLLWDACDYDVHRKSPPTIAELLSNVSQVYENKELSNTNVSVALWKAYEALCKACKIYEDNIRKSPTEESSEINLENYADKELPQDTGEKILPYLADAEKYLTEVENFLKISEDEMPSFWSSPAPIKHEGKKPENKQNTAGPWPTTPSGYDPNEGKCGWHFAQGYKEQPLYRSQHYIFVHEVLRNLFFDEPHNIIAILMADKANDALLDLWHRVEKVFKDLTPSSPDGLTCEVRTLKDGTVVVLINLPPPQKMCEAHLVALVYRSASDAHNREVRFIVLERDNRPILCEWDNVDAHCNRGYSCEPNLDSFFEIVCDLVSKGNGVGKISERIAERHNEDDVSLTGPKTGKDLLAEMTDEQREKFRQFKIKNS